jgi:ketosteroid isomerase-like protein
MTSANVELTREGSRAFNERDLDWLAANCVEDFVWHPAIATGVDGREYRGIEGLREFFAELQEVWDEFEIEPARLLELGPDHVLVFSHVRARGKAGVEFEQEMTGLYEFRDGKVASGRSYLNRDDALRAAAEATGHEVTA